MSSIRFSAGQSLVKVHCVSVTKDIARKVSPLQGPANIKLVGEGDEWDVVWKDSEASLRIQVDSIFGVEAGGFKVSFAVVRSY